MSTSKTDGAGDRFRPAWWLPGPHLQSLWGTLTRSRRLVSFRREPLRAPDGDQLILDHVDGDPEAPRLLLLHGLEGSSFSVYIQGLAAGAAARGWGVTVLNFRFCALDPDRGFAPIPNERPRLYHSGETSDPDWVIRTLVDREPGRPLLALGASLGGNVLLKWLGERPGQRLVAAAAVLGTPFDLEAGARNLERPLGRPYFHYLARSMKWKFADLAARFDEARGLLDLKRVRRARCFAELDDAGTAPLAGFSGAGDYYARSSSVHFVGMIDTPTLCISSQDDPFVPARALSAAREAASSAVEWIVTRRGGHLGWVEGLRLGAGRHWGEKQALAWLTDHSGRQQTMKNGLRSASNRPPS